MSKQLQEQTINEKIIAKNNYHLSNLKRDTIDSQRIHSNISQQMLRDSTGMMNYENRPQDIKDNKKYVELIHQEEDLEFNFVGKKPLKKLSIGTQCPHKLEIPSSQRCKSVEDEPQGSKLDEEKEIINFNQQKLNEFEKNDNNKLQQKVYSQNSSPTRIRFFENGRSSSMDIIQLTVPKKYKKRKERHQSTEYISCLENESPSISHCKTSKHEKEGSEIDPRNIPISCRFDFIRHQQAYLQAKEAQKTSSIINPEIIISQYKKQLNRVSSNDYLSSLETAAYKTIGKQMRQNLTPMICNQIQKKIIKLDKFEKLCNDDLGNKYIHIQNKKDVSPLQTWRSKQQSKNSPFYDEILKEYVQKQKQSRNDGKFKGKSTSQIILSRESLNGSQQNFYNEYDHLQPMNLNKNNAIHNLNSSSTWEPGDNKYQDYYHFGNPYLMKQGSQSSIPDKQQVKASTDLKIKEYTNISPQLLFQDQISQQLLSNKSVFSQNFNTQASTLTETNTFQEQSKNDILTIGEKITMRQTSNSPIRLCYFGRQAKENQIHFGKTSNKSPFKQQNPEQRSLGKRKRKNSFTLSDDKSAILANVEKSFNSQDERFMAHQEYSKFLKQNQIDQPSIIGNSNKIQKCTLFKFPKPLIKDYQKTFFDQKSDNNLRSTKRTLLFSSKNTKESLKNTSTANKNLFQLLEKRRDKESDGFAVTFHSKKSNFNNNN